MIRLALAAALLAATATVPHGVDPWPRSPCDSGILAASAATSAPAQRGVEVVVPAKTACGVATPGPEIAVAVFTPGSDHGTIYPTMLYPYASPTGPTAFRVDGIVSPGEYGLCLMPDYDSRLSCVRVDASSIGPLAVSVSPLATDDPLVARPVRLDDGQGTQPSCPVCWTTTN